MARPKSDGLLYFPLDTDFFTADKRIRALRARFGCDGLVVYLFILTSIYRNGYYIILDEDEIDNIVGCLNLNEGLIRQVVQFLISRSLLESILIGTDNCLTGTSVQRRFQLAMKSLKRDVHVRRELWLLGMDETASFIKFTQNSEKSQKNPDKSRKNMSKSRINDTKENKTKLNNINTMHTVRIEDARALFEQLWILYPNKKGKARVTDAMMEKLYSIGKDEMTRAIDRYKTELLRDEWRKPQYGNVFFSTGYIDYLDANYVPGEVKRTKSDSWNLTMKSNYDFENVEKELGVY